MSQHSLLQHLEELGLQQLSPGVLNGIATGMYQVILPTNFSILERNISEELPSYAELGYEAKVNAEKNMDFIFSNGNESSYSIQIKAEDHQLAFSLKGPSFIQQYKVLTKEEQIFEPKMVVQFNPKLSPSQKIVEEEGKEGQMVKVVRETYSEQGELVQKENISEDFYPPVHRVEVRGSDCGADGRTCYK